MSVETKLDTIIGLLRVLVEQTKQQHVQVTMQDRLIVQRDEQARRRWDAAAATLAGLKE